nr:hypothetical protein [Stenomitos frigidus]
MQRLDLIQRILMPLRVSLLLIEISSFLIILDGGLLVAQGFTGTPPAVIGMSIVGFELDRLVEILDGGLLVA